MILLSCWHKQIYAGCLDGFFFSLGWMIVGWNDRNPHNLATVYISLAIELHVSSCCHRVDLKLVFHLSSSYFMYVDCLEEIPPVVGLKLVVGQDWVSLSSNHRRGNRYWSRLTSDAPSTYQCQSSSRSTVFRMWGLDGKFEMCASFFFFFGLYTPSWQVLYIMFQGPFNSAMFTDRFPLNIYPCSCTLTGIRFSYLLIQERL